jgi:outer membrane cobalamin receptor
MSNQPHRALQSLLPSLVLAISLTACAVGSGPRHAPDGARVITAAQIQRTGALNALEALQRTGTHFSVQQTARGEVTGLTRRGHSSLVLGPSPLVYVDGARTNSFLVLLEVPAAAITRIRIYNGIEGTRFFGTGGGNGVIVVDTHVGPRA